MFLYPSKQPRENTVSRQHREMDIKLPMKQGHLLNRDARACQMCSG